MNITKRLGRTGTIGCTPFQETQQRHQGSAKSNHQERNSQRLHKQRNKQLPKENTGNEPPSKDSTGKQPNIRTHNDGSGPNKINRQNVRQTRSRRLCIHAASTIRTLTSVHREIRRSCQGAHARHALTRRYSSDWPNGKNPPHGSLLKRSCWCKSKA
jgi:hypothetical protein